MPRSGAPGPTRCRGCSPWSTSASTPLARDAWAARLPALRRYRRESAPWLDVLTRHRQTLDEIRALSGPSPDRLAALNLALTRLAPLLKTLEVPADARGAHAAMLGAL